jgi:tetratricopeptide (TPR) repeat protein
VAAGMSVFHTLGASTHRVCEQCSRSVLRAALALLSVCFVQAHSLAQEQLQREERPLIDQQPFDLITLTQEAGGDRVKVAPLPFPNRVVPTNPRESERLEVIVLKFPDRRYEVAWRAIAKIDLYEQMIYDEARRKLEQKEFTAAFQNLSFLLRNYPAMPRLESLRQEFLFRSAEDRFRAGELLQTLSALEELRDTAPTYRADVVTRVMSQVASSLVGRYEQQGDLGSAKAIVERLKNKYGPGLGVVTEWEMKLEQLALAKRDEALQLFEQARYREARRAAIEMMGIFPDEAGRQLINRINATHPMVRVGVMQRSDELDPSSLVNWPARRTGRLVYQPLFQFLQTGSEGGRYGFALGTHRISDDRQQLVLSVDPSLKTGLDAFGLGQLLLERAEPTSPVYDPSWAAIFKSVEAGVGNQVIVNLQRPNVLPHALLQWTLPDTAEQPTLLPASYERQTIDGVETAFTLREGVERNGLPVEIVEVFYDDARKALQDLRQGELDVLDQLYPADARKLITESSRFTVGAYALPTTHMLIPISDDPYLAKDKFRRALLYAFDRQRTLTGELLGDSTNTNDGRVISSPFPLGSGESDPLAYAYDPSIRPREYDPQLAKLLVTMTEQELRSAAEKKKELPPARKKFIVACPDFEFARVATQAMIQQWMKVDIHAEMKILPPDLFTADQIKAEGCDLIYLMTTMWEPATDIERLLGESGLAATDNPFIVQALEALRRARNWREVKLAMQDLHRLIDYHLPVLPLWQVTDRFVVSRHVDGLGDRPVSLYQDVESWRLNLGLQQTAQR